MGLTPHPEPILPYAACVLCVGHICSLLLWSSGLLPFEETWIYNLRSVGVFPVSSLFTKLKAFVFTSVSDFPAFHHCTTRHSSSIDSLSDVNALCLLTINLRALASEQSVPSIIHFLSLVPSSGCHVALDPVLRIESKNGYSFYLVTMKHCSKESPCWVSMCLFFFSTFFSSLIISSESGDYQKRRGQNRKHLGEYMPRKMVES